MRASYDLAIDSYIKEVVNIIDNQETSDISREKACELLQDYRPV